jgi:uncharacterized membrane-anchored protein
MASVKRNVDPADLAIAIRTEKGQMLFSVVHRADGFVVAHKQPVENPALQLELVRTLAMLGVEPEHELATTRDELERDRATAVRELAEVKQLFHQEQSLSGSLTDKVAELEGEKSQLSSRLALVERERTELLGRVTAYDKAAREMVARAESGDEPNQDGPPTNPGGRPATT